MARTKFDGNFNRLNDRFFKYLFTTPDYKHLLIALLNEVLMDMPPGADRIPPIVDLNYADRETSPFHQDDKVPRFDVLARTEGGKILHVEVQLRNEENLVPRILHYGARDYVLAARSGGSYMDVQVIFIAILNFSLFKDSGDYHAVHRILNVRDGSWRMRGLEFHFIEMPKVRRDWPETGLERMLQYLGSIGGEKRMEALASVDARVAKMAELEMIFRSDPDLLTAYMLHEDNQRDYQLSLKDSERRGIALGQLQTLSELVRKGLLSLKDASVEANMTEDEFAERIRALPR